MNMKILAGDIGGTNTRLICADVSGNETRVLAENTYFSSDYSSLDQIIHRFLSEYNLLTAVNAACFAVAGPVKSGIAAVTNLPWVISEQELSKSFHIPYIKLVNDFVAVTYGLSELKDTDFLVLQQPIAKDEELHNPSAAIIGAGTGLGVSHRVWLNNQYHAFSSEAGHVGFAPENEQQSELLRWLQKKHGHVSLETLLSGKGLAIIYNFLRDIVGIQELQEILKAMTNGDPAQIITESAISGIDALCEKTLECFIDIYGSAAGNIALHYYPVDEVYIAGGIANKIKPLMSNQRFIKAFTNKGAMTSNMKGIYLKLITQEKVGLYGALSHARTLL